MGLDMYLYKINKKVNTEKEVKTINEVIKLNGGNKFEELEKVVGFIKNNDDESYINSDYKMFINEFKNVYMSIKDKPKDELDNEVQVFHSLTEKEAFNAVEKEKEKDLELYELFINNKDILDGIEIHDIGYWRKHPDFHKIMEDKYYEKGGEGTFNCSPLILSKEEIKEIIELSDDIINDKKESEKASGFFWGQTVKDHWVQTKEIFEKALKETDFDNETIYYDSWW